jgi:phosphoribosylformylglycinamidine (FGAM) synthase-like amidotransferase family enzyme
MRDVNVLVMSGFGLNCDTETAYAFQLAGAKTQSVHINSLIDGSARLEDFQIMVFIGGFSWADDHGAGVVQAVRRFLNLSIEATWFSAFATGFKHSLISAFCRVLTKIIPKDPWR